MMSYLPQSRIKHKDQLPPFEIVHKPNKRAFKVVHSFDFSAHNPLSLNSQVQRSLFGVQNEHQTTRKKHQKENIPLLSSEGRLTEPIQTTKVGDQQQQKTFHETFTVKSPITDTQNTITNLAGQTAKQSQLRQTQVLNKNAIRVQISKYPGLEPAKVSSQRPQNYQESLVAYAANTHNGIIRQYNEDRISIVLDLKSRKQASSGQQDRKVQFFAIFDGHGGNGCSEFLRDNLHNMIAQSQSFPLNLERALQDGCEVAEKQFMKQNLDVVRDKSGSCAIICLLCEQTVYVANIGDSRAILSQENGKIVFPLSQDHKPSDANEKRRIIAAGGKVYQNQAINVIDMYGKKIQPPMRVLPGRLSVSRAFGDCIAKLERYGGNPNCIVALPEITIFQLQPDTDWILLGCDGIFDHLDNNKIKSVVYDDTRDFSEQMTAEIKFGSFEHVSSCCGAAVNGVMRTAMEHESTDNLSVVLIVFSNFRKQLGDLSRPTNLQPGTQLQELQPSQGQYQRERPNRVIASNNCLKQKYRKVVSQDQQDYNDEVVQSSEDQSGRNLPIIKSQSKKLNAANHYELEGTNKLSHLQSERHRLKKPEVLNNFQITRPVLPVYRGIDDIGTISKQSLLHTLRSKKS